MSFASIIWPAYKRFYMKVCRYLDANRYIERYTEPKIRSASEWAKESQGGPIPDDLVEIVNTRNSDEYLGKANIWVEFCIRSTFSNAA